MSETLNNNKKILKNTFFLYIRMFFVLLVSLYTSRVVLNVLGVSDYGVYNVVAGFVLLFGFLNATLSASMQRFYNFEGGTKGDNGYRDVYSTGFWIHVILAFFVFIVLESFGLWYINNVMVIENNRLVAANYLFQFSTLSMVLVILQVPYLSAILAKEHMNYYALVSIIDALLKLIIVIALPFFSYDKLVIYGSLSLLIALADFGMYYFYSKINFAFIKLNKTINKKIFKDLLSFSGWNLIGTFAFLLRGQGLNLLLNGFFNTIVNAARGIAFQVNNAINGFTGNIATAFRPQIVQSYAQEEFNRTSSLMFVESKLCYSLILVLIIPVILEIDYIFHLWLGETVPPQSNIFSSLVLIDLLFSSLNQPITQVAFATGKIKKFQIGNSIVNLLLLPVCFFFLRMGFQPVSVFLLTIIFTFFNQIVCVYLLHQIFNFSYMDYLRKIILPCIVVSFLLPIFPLILRLNMDSSFLRLLMVCTTDVLMALILVYFVMLDKREKTAITNFISYRFKRN